jgi:hypothetical protein
MIVAVIAVGGCFGGHHQPNANLLDDKVTIARVQSALNTSGGLNDVKIATTNGVVTLTGSVASEQQKKKRIKSRAKYIVPMTSIVRSRSNRSRSRRNGHAGDVSHAEVPIQELDVTAYRIPTDGPDSDGTLEWDSTPVRVLLVPKFGLPKTANGWVLPLPALPGLVLASPWGRQMAMVESIIFPKQSTLTQRRQRGVALAGSAKGIRRKIAPELLSRRAYIELVVVRGLPRSRRARSLRQQVKGVL